MNILLFDLLKGAFFESIVYFIIIFITISILMLNPFIYIYLFIESIRNLLCTRCMRKPITSSYW